MVAMMKRFNKFLSLNNLHMAKESFGPPNLRFGGNELFGIKLIRTHYAIFGVFFFENMESFIHVLIKFWINKIVYNFYCILRRLLH